MSKSKDRPKKQKKKPKKDVRVKVPSDYKFGGVNVLR